MVESRRTALAEAGDLVMAGTASDQVVTLSELVRGATLRDEGPRVFKSTGMSWEDAVLVDALLTLEPRQAER